MKGYEHQTQPRSIDVPGAMNRTIHAALVATTLSTAACGGGHNFLSASVAQEPAPFRPPMEFLDAARGNAAPAQTSTDTPSARAQPPTFYKTQDSSDWVAHTFNVQSKYARVKVCMWRRSASRSNGAISIITCTMPSRIEARSSLSPRAAA